MGFAPSFARAPFPQVAVSDMASVIAPSPPSGGDAAPAPLRHTHAHLLFYYIRNQKSARIYPSLAALKADARERVLMGRTEEAMAVTCRLIDALTKDDTAVEIPIFNAIGDDGKFVYVKHPFGEFEPRSKMTYTSHFFD